MKHWSSIQEKMSRSSCSELAISAFKYNYQNFLSESEALISGDSIEGVSGLSDAEELAEDKSLVQLGNENLQKTAIIKLNGGLGTSMGLDKAKSLLVARDGLSFLDIIIEQTLELRKRSGSSLPLILMNSFRTEADSLAVLRKSSEFLESQGKYPLSFLQNKIPRLDATEFSAVDEAPGYSGSDWCPPGHGDIYTALYDRGVLQSLIDGGFRYLFISNADNLGASLDASILGYFIDSGSEFLMEVADRTTADKKGGHLAKRKADSQVILRELAQCPDEDLDDFQNTEKFSYFNTNSLWVDLIGLKKKLVENEGILHLPLIVNRKEQEKTGLPIVQLETAMGSAIGLFDKASAVRVPRSRFIPVKKTDDLIALRSDVFQKTPDGRVSRNPECPGVIDVSLDKQFYGKMEAFEKRFPKGVPSLKECSRLEVEGDVRFGRGVVIKGDVSLKASKGELLQIKDGEILQG